MRKRFLPVLLVLCMVLVMLPVAAAATSEGGTGTGGTGTTTTTPKFEIPEEANFTDKSKLTDNKYITGTGEGVSLEWDGNYYSVTAWLKYAEDDLAKIDANGRVKGDSTLSSAASQLLGAKAANENSTAEAKTELTKLIEATEAKFTAIKKLDLTTKSDGTALTMTDLTPLQYFTGLEELIISGQKIQGVNPENNTTTAGLLDSHVFSALKNLKVLKAENCGLTNIEALATCTGLTTLDLSGNTGLTSVSALAGVKTGTDTDPTFNAPLAALTTLDLSGCTALEEVGALAKCQNLTTLDISNTGVKNLNFLYVEDEDATGAATTSLSKLANLTATGLTLNVFTDASTNSISGAMQLVEKTADFKATKWDFGSSIKLGTNLTNQQKQLINNFIEGMGSALTSTLTKQTLTIDATLSSLSVSGTKITNISFNAATLTYNVDVPADTKEATITATPTNGYEISAVKFGDQTQPDVTTALAKINVSDPKGIHVQIVVSKTDDPLNHQAYVICFNKLNEPTYSFNPEVTDGEAEVTVSDDVADATITAAKEKAEANKTAVFNVVNRDAKTEMTSAAVTISASKLSKAQTEGISVKVDAFNNDGTKLVSVGSVKLSPTALGVIVNKAGGSSSTKNVTIAVSKENKMPDTISSDVYQLLGNFKITVSVDGTPITGNEWGTLSTTAKSEDILLMFPIAKLQTDTDPFKVFLDGQALPGYVDNAQYYLDNGIVFVRAPHLSEVTIVKDRLISAATYSVTDASGSIGYRVTINNATNGNYYIVQVGDSAPAAIFCLKASGTTVEFYASTNDASKLKIWDAGSSVGSFTGGTPGDNLEEVLQKAE